jgi:hypothetical protein
MTELCKLAFKYGSDKCPQIRHHYTPLYYDLLKDKRESVRKVLEIGVGNKEYMNNYPNYKDGASLFMWRDFFPNAQIYGADVIPELVFKDERIETFLCNQSVKEDLNNLILKTGSDIDLFIDDGSHYVTDQGFTCQIIMPQLKKDVIYVIEDVGDPSIGERYLGEYDYRVTRFRHKNIWDDRLIIVRNEGFE